MAALIGDENNAHDFEASIQISRILKIISNTIKNCEIVLCLPHLISDNSNIIHSNFPEDQAYFIEEVCKKVSHKLSHETDDEEGHADISVVIDMILSQPDLVNFCRKTLSQEISRAGKTLLRNLEEFRYYIGQRLQITPKMEAQEEAELRRMYHENIKNKEEVEKLNDKLDKLNEETQEEIEGKTQLIKQQLEKIEKLKKQCKDSIKKRMDEAERQISWDIKNSEYRLDELQAGAKIAQSRCEMQLKEHLNSERDLRAKRYKVESQLVTLLQKYDTDIGERQTQLEELTSQFEEEKEQMEQLQTDFNQLEVDYENLMIEKEHYERRVWEAKLYDIQCRIAARKIQRFWRAYLATRAKGKKGKKGKKKK